MSKNYHSSDFRTNLIGTVNHNLDNIERRHILDCELAAYFANSTTGPSYSDSTMRAMRDVMRHDNLEYYSNKSANLNDRYAVRAAFDGERLSPHQAAHIRKGAEFIVNHRDSLPPGFVNTAREFYGGLKDVNGHCVFDMRKWRQ